jgi:hypothetical protein
MNISELLFPNFLRSTLKMEAPNVSKKQVSPCQRTVWQMSTVSKNRLLCTSKKGHFVYAIALTFILRLAGTLKDAVQEPPQHTQLQKLSLLNNIYFSCVILAHGSPTFLWQRGETVTFGWLEGRTWKNKNKWYTQRLKLLLNFYSTYIILKYGRGHKITWWPAGWRPKSCHKAAQAIFAVRTRT